MDSSPNIRWLVSLYYDCKNTLIEDGYSSEIDWQEGIELDNVTEQELIKEMAWVILNTGMKESVIRKIYIRMSVQVNWWNIQNLSQSHLSMLREVIYMNFSNKKKVDSIIYNIVLVKKIGVIKFKEELKKFNIGFLECLNYIGPVTKYHLAKNLGVDIGKPDRHLERISNIFGYDCPNLLCKEISRATGEKMSVVDLVLWRYAANNPDYENIMRRTMATTSMLLSPHGT